MNSPASRAISTTAEVRVLESKASVGAAAAKDAAQCLGKTLAEERTARIIVATGNSQLETVAALTHRASVDWRRVEVFHMDEYVGLAADHPASFRRWVKEMLMDVVHPGTVHFLQGDAANVEDECRRYAELLNSDPIHVCLLGIGENGHLAFNDPHEANFDDPLSVKRVTLDPICRMQQVGEGHFRELNDVPSEALTLTIPALMRSKHLICSVPERRKAEAVRNALQGPLTPKCPASLLRVHSGARIYLDNESASLLGVAACAPETGAILP